MRFYVISSVEDESVVGCTTGLTAARSFGAKTLGRGQYYIDLVEIAMTPRETIRRLLGGHGGYAANQKRVYP